jgi:hypothetical protein
VSLNLGNEALAALRSLRASPDFRVLHEALGEQVRRYMNASLDMESGNLAIGVGYARALRDFYMAIEAGLLDQPINRIEKPAPVKSRASAAFG